ncbi:hypothetical protein N7537_003497 [Penicillium hordei]|uniref:Uncharacterized protein n=1 Tax=Penicillium hordei TaxID=40994 RepID=A0AAD6EA55_9EURO|nr:uncharacterized protein N7537_003497 [Penicillium hordei]KAJ5606878.1 hypothetical protein N7537_003497 [Penicillium hordei]
MTSQFEYLTDLDGTKMTLDAVTEEVFHFPAQTWKEDDLVPGGFVTYVVWEKVPGDSFDHLKFRLRPFNEREAIRDKHISGIRFPYRPDEPQEWQDRFFYRFALAPPDRNPGALMPGIERNKADWKEDENGWVLQEVWSH